MYPRCCRINFGFYSSTLVDKEAFYSSTLVDKEAKKPDTKCPAKNIFLIFYGVFVCCFSINCIRTTDNI